MSWEKKQVSIFNDFSFLPINLSRLSVEICQRKLKKEKEKRKVKRVKQLWPPLTRILLVPFFFFPFFLPKVPLLWPEIQLIYDGLKGSFSTMSRILIANHCSLETMSTVGVPKHAKSHRLRSSLPKNDVEARSSWLETLFAHIADEWRLLRMVFIVKRLRSWRLLFDLMGLLVVSLLR